MLNADCHPATHRLRGNNTQKEKPFSDIAIGTFRCDRGRTLNCCTGGLEGSFTGHDPNLRYVAQQMSIPFTSLHPSAPCHNSPLGNPPHFVVTPPPPRSSGTVMMWRLTMSPRRGGGVLHHKTRSL